MTDQRDEKGSTFSIRDKRRVHLDDEASTETSGEQAPRASEPPPAGGESSSEERKQEGTDPASGPSAEEMKSAASLADEAARPHKQAPEVDFTTFVISLASSAMVHLGQAPHPDGGKNETNLPMAKQVVDMLAMLKEKTAGNLEPDEARYLEAILYDLRLRFVEAAKARGK